ncbi:MAG: endonuclease MutS2, partial [Clostridia bacterium]|nr:endonuclease MutS2 [Clostridia bacterium]
MYDLNKSCKTLELNQILEMLASLASMPDAKEKALNIMPSNSLSEVSADLKLTEDAYILMSKYSSPTFSNTQNISSALHKADIGATLSIRELLDIGETLRIIRGVKGWREDSSAKEKYSIDRYFSSLTPNKFIEEKIFFAIKSEDEISDNASPELSSIRRKIAQCSSKIRDDLEKIVRGGSSKYLQDAIITQRDGRFVVPVRTEYKGEIKGIVHDTSSSGSTLFVEPMSVVETNNEIRVLKSKEQDEIARILAELSANVGEFAESIKYSFNALVELNLIFAKARLAINMNASVPNINGNGYVNLINARHPLINKNEVVPISLSLGGDYDTLIITGPNTGGKTVTLKTVGLLCLMAMCGLMIPAGDNSEIAVFDKIFADIGDEQSIEQSLSTFSSHMVNIVTILDECNENSLVLFDELCAGTDPIEGAALAKAILTELNEKHTKCIATTHYSELKSYAIDAYKVENASCEFDIDTLKPTYKLI